MLLDGLGELVQLHEPALDARRRERALNGALATLSMQRSSMPAPRGSVLAWSLAASALLGSIANGVWSSQPAPQRAQTTSGAVADRAPAQPAPGDRVIAGALLGEHRRPARAIGAAVPGGEALFAPDGASVQLAHAQVVLSPATRVRWSVADSQLKLIAGSVLADVDASKHLPFSVKTLRFTARVLGTRFAVDLVGVRVERGVVRVVAGDGTALAPDLRAGDHFALPAPAVATTPLPSATPATLPATTPAHAAMGSVDRQQRVPADRSARGEAVSRLLQHARESLATRDASAARGEIGAALALRPGRALQAEALSLRAECALVEGDVPAALKAYLHVARSFAQLPAAQNALYAAARLHAEHGNAREAAQLFARWCCCRDGRSRSCSRRRRTRRCTRGRSRRSARRRPGRHRHRTRTGDPRTLGVVPARRLLRARRARGARAVR